MNTTSRDETSQEKNVLGDNMSFRSANKWLKKAATGCVDHSDTCTEAVKEFKETRPEYG